MVVHRDLKPENLLLDSKHNIKISDFGLSNVMRDGYFLKTSCGSPNYAAPEIISEKLYAGPERGLYTFPCHLSALPEDLISKMLVVDPMKRITIGQIREHEWFKIRLPRYLAVPPPHTSQQAKKIDEHILLQVTKMGFNRDQLIESLNNRIQNEATISYYLLFDNRFHDMTAGYLGGGFQETMVQECLHTSSSDIAIPNRLPAFPNTEKKWALGFESRAHPREIMTEVLKALRDLNVSWKNIGNYNIKCLYLPGRANDQGIVETEGAGTTARIEDRSIMCLYIRVLQLYKTLEEKYLLDLMRVSGPQLQFLDLCADLLVQLRVLGNSN
ncbi:hypothetical protein ZIOFF_034573 [Zingiber officinale]|uniref:non-specific serine/threonine protein kinase n=1 Tax=Zingiber officinale TaxID=94328 RepID=A0A8J5LDP4_ZINOF|nr:hypothetical protein ZIOFF_034573 [Zingiber officinale]